MKNCRVCKINKSLSEFGVDSRRIDKKRSECFLCRKLEYNYDSKSIYNKIWYQKNKEKIIKNSQKYYLKNKNKIRIYKNILDKRKAKDSIQYKLSRSLRSRLRSILKYNLKNGSAVRDLGCSVEFLKNYLENQFQPGMNWNNYGNKKYQWSIDHIIPLSKVDLTNKIEFLKVCHYTNLRPMWHSENVIKGNKL